MKTNENDWRAGRKMLSEERQKIILEMLESKGSVEGTELMAALDASESTIRRDLNAMDEAGLLTKVHGGAIAKTKQSYITLDRDLEQKRVLHTEEKKKIAAYAASLITDDDFVYMDAGTTTELMIDFIEAKNATFVTNAINNARLLSQRGCKTFLLGGEFKSVTEAIVGEEAIANIEKYNFTKGFFGVNGITKKNGYTTPEIKEAMIKKKAMLSSKDAYVLADSSKFGEISPVCFNAIQAAEIITEFCPKEFEDLQNVIVVK
jgi:DeoR family transcriptional regulator, fructose operon transcriptional repressor